MSESLLRFSGEGVPICFTEIGEGAVWGFWASYRKNTAQLDDNWEVIGVESGEGALL